MKTAYNLIPPRFADGRHLAVSEGLRRCSYEVVEGLKVPTPQAGDLVCTWNLHTFNARQAKARADAAGCPVVVCEEGYTRRLCRGPHFAMALGGHNGAGRWPSFAHFRGASEGQPMGVAIARQQWEARWDRLGLRLKPWRPSTSSGQGVDRRHVLVCAARGMGSPEMREPRGWGEEVCRRLAEVTERSIVLRRHPGKSYAARPLARDLEGAWAVVVWASNCATQALAEGVPAFFEAPHIITAGAAEPGIAKVEEPSYPDRLPAFRRLAWAQWSLDEIRRGKAFAQLLQIA